MTIAILGPGGVGGLLAGLLERAGTPVVVVARTSTAAVISTHGVRVDSVSFGDFVAPPACAVPPGGAGRCVDRGHQGLRAGGCAGEDRDAAKARVAAAQRSRSHRNPAPALPGRLRARRDDPRRGRPARAGRGGAHQPVPARGNGQRGALRTRGHGGSRKNAVRRGSAGSRARFRGAGDVVKARAAERAGMHHERVRRAARDDPLDARDARLPGRGDRRRAARLGAPREPRTWIRPRR